MKRFYPFVLLLSLLLVFVSCKKEETQIQQLQRYWNFIPGDTDNDLDTTHFLNLQKNNIFTFYKGGDTIKGTWKTEQNQLILTSLVKDIETHIDSIAHKLDHQGIAQILYYNNNQLIGILKEGKLDNKEVSQIFNLTKVSSENLLLGSVHDANTFYAFKYKPKVVPSGFSAYSVMRGLIGLLVLVFITFLLSSNRKAINWSLVIKGLAIQIVLAVSVLYIPFVAAFFDALCNGFIKIIGVTDRGVDFVFGSFGTGKVEAPLLSFAFKILPTIIFFSALMSMLYYMGILQKIVYVFAWIMKRIMNLSGAESLAAAGNIFMGQTESPLLIKPYLEKMTKSELMCLMTGGMATIAGGVLAAYIGFLGGDDPAEQVFFAKHLLTASVMSAPAAVVAAKILVPETKEFSHNMNIPKDKIGDNILEAITNGTTDGLKLAVNVGAMLLVFTALIYLGNGILGKIGDLTGLNDIIAAKSSTYKELSFQFLLGYTFAPIAGLLGIDSWNDMKLMGQLLGEKTILNEFYAYSTLGKMKAADMFETRKGIVMSTYMLCGFANFASIGIQIGGIGALIPSRKGLLSQLGLKAMIGGTIACLFTSVIVGMLM